MPTYVMTQFVLPPMWKDAFFEGVRTTIPESRQLREVPNGTYFYDGQCTWGYWWKGKFTLPPANKVPAIYRTWVLILS